MTVFILSFARCLNEFRMSPTTDLIFKKFSEVQFLHLLVKDFDWPKSPLSLNLQIPKLIRVLQQEFEEGIAIESLQIAA